MNYSEPVEKLLNFKELLERIYVSDILPDAIPMLLLIIKEIGDFVLVKIIKINL